MEKLELIHFVVSKRDQDTGEILYEIGDNYTELPRGARQVYGTGHYNRDIVMMRLQKCNDGIFFKEQKAERLARQKEDEQLRKEYHKSWLKNRQNYESRS